MLEDGEGTGERAADKGSFKGRCDVNTGRGEREGRESSNSLL